MAFEVQISIVHTPNTSPQIQQHLSSYLATNTTFSCVNIPLLSGWCTLSDLPLLRLYFFRSSSNGIHNLPLNLLMTLSFPFVSVLGKGATSAIPHLQLEPINLSIRSLEILNLPLMSFVYILDSPILSPSSSINLPLYLIIA